MFPWEVHNGWSPSLVQLISVISAIGWAPASLNPLSLLHLPPPPPPHFFFLFSRIVPPGERPFLRTGFATRRPPQPFATVLPPFRGENEKEWKRIAGHTRWTEQVRASFSESFLRNTFSVSGGSFLFFFFFYAKSTGRKETGDLFYSSSNIITRLYILWIFCVSFACP